MTSAYPALVLNADFTPVSTFPLSVWDFERTMRKTIKDRVIVLETYDVVLTSSNTLYTPPSVVALKRVMPSQDRVPFTRMNLFLRDEFTCQYCCEKHLPRDLTFDHVIPRKDGGLTSWENIVAACVPCNSKKGHRRDLVPIKTPVKPSVDVMQRMKAPIKNSLHRSWLDYLYWSGVLETN
jgi:5-methylcytosine-specific restriction endonuclease McrA